ncbi:alpha/beta-hydrolase [Trichocladium antarcticum]|uniref:Alpha/beta-hydrolase n=1 Tax=Trichocladium antarcticum TaxID=1450529 RepID=A0AAN6ZI81_9PEZI|nr:alpha/beta-hydrolase [Trichocladium antarcticum]
MGSMFDGNPSLIQDPAPARNVSPWANKATPLVLIHDGGGTTFSYYCLGELDRRVYGIANPHYQSGGTWHGGIPEMAAHYLRLIKAAVPRGDIIIGGWSLGGLVALEVAHQLAREAHPPPLNLLGIVMVDSVCPMVLTAPVLPVIQHAVEWSQHTRQETKDRIMRSFAESSRMVREWTLPVWDAAQAAGQDEGAANVPSHTHTHTGNGRVLARPPPVILIRAMEPVPVPEEGAVSRVDVHRGDRLLGWGGYRKDMITSVMDIPGHHFNIFHTEKNLETSTAAIKRACLDIEEMHARGTSRLAA